MATSQYAAWKDGSHVTHASGWDPTKEEVHKLEGDRLIPGASLVMGLAGKKSQAANFPDRPAMPSINASAWAIDIIAAVNEAVAQAKAEPVGGWNPLARAVAEVKAEGMLVIALAADSVAAVKNHVYQAVTDPMGKPSLTKAGVEDYIARVKAAKALSANVTGLHKHATSIRPNVTFDKDQFVEGLKAVLGGNNSVLKTHPHAANKNWTLELIDKVEALKGALEPQKLVGHSSYTAGFPGTEHLHLQRAQNPAGKK